AIVVHKLVAVLAGIRARIGLRGTHRGARHGEIKGTGLGRPQVAGARIGEPVPAPAEAQLVDHAVGDHRSPGSLAVFVLHGGITVVGERVAVGQNTLRLDAVWRYPSHVVHIEAERV